MGFLILRILKNKRGEPIAFLAIFLLCLFGKKSLWEKLFRKICFVNNHINQIYIDEINEKKLKKFMALLYEGKKMFCSYVLLGAENISLNE